MEDKDIVKQITEKSIRSGANKIIEATVDAFRMYGTDKETSAYVSGYTKGLGEGINLAIELLSDLIKEARENNEPKVTYTVKGVSN